MNDEGKINVDTFGKKKRVTLEVEESIEFELFPKPCLMAPWAVAYVLMHVYKCLRDSVSKVECCLRLLTQDRPK